MPGEGEGDHAIEDEEGVEEELEEEEDEGGSESDEYPAEYEVFENPTDSSASSGEG